MTSREIFDMCIGGSDELARIIGILAETGSYCLIGDYAVNCHVDPVYTEDADFAIWSDRRDDLKQAFRQAGFRIRENRYDIEVQLPGSRLKVHLTFDDAYRGFPERAEERRLYGEIPVKVASLEDLVQGKVRAWSDPARKLVKREKDRLDLLRIGESYPELRKLMPGEIIRAFDDDRDIDQGMTI